MELSASWEATSCAATQELPYILCNSKFHCRVHKGRPLVPVLSQINPVRTTTSYISKIHFDIIHLPTSWSSKWSLSFWLSHQYSICMLRSRSCYMPSPSHTAQLGRPNYTWRRVQVMKLLIMQFSPTCSHFIPLRSKYSPQLLSTLFSRVIL
jgi:hypothetical protein